MKRYRVVTKLSHDAQDVMYYVQRRWAFIWWNETEPGFPGYNYTIKCYSLDRAKEKVNELVAKDTIEAERKGKHKAFKSKVVYGPYPP